jgi:hypothetical protein
MNQRSRDDHTFACRGGPGRGARWASAGVGSATTVPPRDLEVISGSGKVTTSIGAGSASVSALVRQPDGKLVAAGPA